ncbi:MAG: nucleotidyltransferase domain-containing protein [Candidatus Omnitrophota bacterium]
MNFLEKQILDDLKSLLSQRIPLHRMILFGSRARGDADPDSDMDVLVIVEGRYTQRMREIVSECAWEAGFGRGIVVSTVVYSREDWENGPEKHSLLALAIEKEGVPI